MKAENVRIALLLTGTVRAQVKGSNFSVEERMEMYHSTLLFYARELGKKYPIVLVENSDVNLSSWKEEFKDSLRLEILQFSPPIQNEKRIINDNGFDNRKGKGYNEYLMIKLGLEQSETLRRSTHFLKLTGRYPMLNIREMLKEMESRGKDKLMMLDVKEFGLYEKLRGTFYGSRWGTPVFS